MKKLTKEQSLMLCIELWDWLAMNPEKGKEDWFSIEEWKKGPVLHNCFACEYAFLQREKKIMAQARREHPAIVPTVCFYCPLKGRWGRDYCTSYNSTYDAWEMAKKETDLPLVSAWAQCLADTAREALEELRRKKKVKI